MLVNSAICMSDCIMAGPLAATNVFAFAPAPINLNLLLSP